MHFFARIKYLAAKSNFDEANLQSETSRVVVIVVVLTEDVDYRIMVSRHLCLTFTTCLPPDRPICSWHNMTPVPRAGPSSADVFRSVAQMDAFESQTIGSLIGLCFCGGLSRFFGFLRVFKGSLKFVV